MNLILLGAPGAGKGTQAAAITTLYNIPHISTGDILRKNVREGTPIGIKAKEYMDGGALVPDEVVIEIVRQRISEPDCVNGYLLDGFPRTKDQAAALDKITKIGRVINIDIDLKLLLRRLTGRRVCDKCGETGHITTITGEICTKCNSGKWIQRLDDNEKTVSNRLSVYESQTAPLISYYSDKGVLVNVNGAQEIGMVREEVLAVLKTQMTNDK